MTVSIDDARKAFILPDDPSDAHIYGGLLDDIVGSSVGRTLLTAITEAHRRRDIAPVSFNFDYQLAYGLGVCQKSDTCSTVSLRRCLGEDEEENGLPVGRPLTLSVLVHEINHARQPRFGAHLQTPYLQTYLIFTSRFVECDAFATQILYALDTGNDDIIDATLHYLTRDMDAAKKTALFSIADNWQANADSADKDKLVADIFWFMHDSGYLKRYDDSMMEYARDCMNRAQGAVDVPPADQPAPKDIHDICFDFFIKMQSMPSLTGGRGGWDYLGDDHEGVVRRLVQDAIMAQYPAVSIETAAPKAAKTTVFKAG